MSVDPADFYTGLVADLYRPLRGHSPDASFIAKFIAKHGEPALELGCGDGDPILELRQLGVDVDGIDSSADMIERCRTRANSLGVSVDVSVQRMETMQLPRSYRSIYLAGGTFTLLRDDASAAQALQRIRSHLSPGGCALVPLYIPDAIRPEELNQWRSDVDEQGRVIRFATVGCRRDDDARVQTLVLRYERDGEGATESLERDFALHWYTRDHFRALAESVGLRVARVIPDDPDTAAFAFWLSRDDEPA